MFSESGRNFDDCEELNAIHQLFFQWGYEDGKEGMSYWLVLTPDSVGRKPDTWFKTRYFSYAAGYRIGQCERNLQLDKVGEASLRQKYRVK